MRDPWKPWKVMATSIFGPAFSKPCELPCATKLTRLFFPRRGGLDSSELKSQSQGFFYYVGSAKHFVTMVIRMKRTLASDLAWFLFWAMHNDSQRALWRGLCGK